MLLRARAGRAERNAVEAEEQRLTDAQFRAVCEFKTMTEARRAAAFRLTVQGAAPADVARDNGWTRQTATALRKDVFATWRRFEAAAAAVWPTIGKKPRAPRRERRVTRRK